MCLANVIYITKQEKVSIYYLGMFVNRAQPPPPPASVNLFLQHGAKPCKVSIALFVDYSYYSSTIRGLFVLFVDYSRTIRTIRRLFADYSYYSSTIRTIRFTILVLSIATKTVYILFVGLFADYSHYSSTIRGLFVLFVDYSHYSLHYSSFINCHQNSIHISRIFIVV